MYPLSPPARLVSRGLVAGLPGYSFALGRGRLAGVDSQQYNGAVTLVPPLAASQGSSQTWVARCSCASVPWHPRSRAGAAVPLHRAAGGDGRADPGRILGPLASPAEADIALPVRWFIPGGGRLAVLRVTPVPGFWPLSRLKLSRFAV